jgi:multicomponent K+:H+ antiporter subunit E
MIGAGKRVLPRPGLSAALLITWILAHQSLEPKTLLIGTCAAIALPILTRRFWPEVIRVRRWGRLVRFLGIFGYDILVANVQVARLVLGPAEKLRPAFLEVPIALENPLAISLLSAVISLAPGTVAANLSGDRKTLLVHALHTEDAEAAIRRIKERYEAPLEEIFA